MPFSSADKNMPDIEIYEPNARPLLVTLCARCRKFNGGACPTLSILFEELMVEAEDDAQMPLWFTCRGFKQL